MSSPRRSRRRLGVNGPASGGAGSSTPSLLRQVVDPALQSPARKRLRTTRNSNGSKNDSNNVTSDGEQSSMEMANARDWVQAQKQGGGSQGSLEGGGAAGGGGMDTPRTLIRKMHANPTVKKLDKTGQGSLEGGGAAGGGGMDTPRTLIRKMHANPTVKKLDKTGGAGASEKALSRTTSGGGFTSAANSDLSDRTPVIDQDDDSIFKTPPSKGLVRRAPGGGARQGQPNNDENQENQESMASSVDEDASSIDQDVNGGGGGVKLTRRARKQQLQKTARRSKENSLGHHQTHQQASISQSPPKTAEPSTRKRGGLLDAEDVSDMRRNMRQRQQSAEDAFALIQPAQSEDEEDAIRRQNEKLKNFMELPSQSGSDGSGAAQGNVSKAADMSTMFRPNAESTRYPLDVSTSGSAVAPPAMVRPSADSEVQFRSLRNVPTTSNKTKLTSVEETPEDEMEDIQATESRRSTVARLSTRQETTATKIVRHSSDPVTRARALAATLPERGSYQSSPAKSKRSSGSPGLKLSADSESRTSRRSKGQPKSNQYDDITSASKTSRKNRSSGQRDLSSRVSGALNQNSTRRNAGDQEEDNGQPENIDDVNVNSGSRLSRRNRSSGQAALSSSISGVVEMNQNGQAETIGDINVKSGSRLSRRNRSSEALSSSISGVVELNQNSSRRNEEEVANGQPENLEDVNVTSGSKQSRRNRSTSGQDASSLNISGVQRIMSPPPQETETPEDLETPPPQNTTPRNASNRRSLRNKTDDGTVETRFQEREMEVDDDQSQTPPDVDDNDEVEEINRRLLGLGIVPHHMSSKAGKAVRPSVSGSKLAGKTPVVKRRAARKPKPQPKHIMSTAEIRWHFRRLYGSAVPNKCFGPILKAFENFMTCFMGSLKEVQEESGLGWNNMMPVVKELLVQYKLLDDNSSNVQLFNMIKDLMTHEEFNLLVPPVDLSKPLPQKNPWKF